MKHILFFLLLFKMSFGFSQIENYYGGCGLEDVKDFIITNDGFNILGVSNSFDWGTGDIYDIMIDSSGVTKWAKTYRIDHTDESPSSIISWNDNLKIILGGNGNGFHDPYLMAIDSLGQNIWSNSANQYEIDDVIKSKTNELVTCGRFFYSSGSASGSAPVISTLDSLGNLISSKHFVFSPQSFIVSEHFRPCKIMQDIDSNYLISGPGYVEPGQSVLFIIKLDKNKNLLWTKVFDYRADYFVKLINTQDNNYLISGYRYQELFVMKLDTSGNMIWLKEFSVDATVTDFIKTTDDKYLLLTDNATLIKLDDQGNIIWSYQFDANIPYYSTSKVLEFNNNYYLLKSSLSNPLSITYSPQFYGSDMLIIKIDTSGNSSFQQIIPSIAASTVNNINLFNYIFTPVDSNVTFSPIIFLENNVSSTFSDSSDCINVGVNELTTIKPIVNIFPNPASEILNFQGLEDVKGLKEICVLSVSGENVIKTSSQSSKMNISLIAKGIYIVQIKYDDGIETLRFVKE